MALMISNRANYGQKRSKNRILYIVLHYTANRTDSAKANATYFAKNTIGASAHYFVDDGEIWQSVPDDYTAYAVGGKKYADCTVTGGGTLYGKVTNANSISIEMCSRNGQISAATVERAAALARDLMQTYSVPPERVVRHFDVNGKHCPGWQGWYGKKAPLWDAFKAKLTTPYTYNGADLSAVFDATFYATQYPDLQKAGLITPPQLFDHFTRFGMMERRQGCATFNVATYAARYKDLQTAFGDDWQSYYLHFCLYGKAEGRVAI